MEREYKMPMAIEHKLHDVYEKQERGDKGEVAVIDAASDLGYEVEDEKVSQQDRGDGGFMRDVKLVKREIAPWGEVVHVGWAHFNQPGKDYEGNRGEWYMYFL